MRKIIVFGNSGSGKSTLAKKLHEEGLAHLDLDTLAWLPSKPPERRPLAQSLEKIRAFISNNSEWVVEGCYADLLELVQAHANEAIFMNLSTQLCQENATNRPWEPHKYESKEEQDSNLPMLLEWIEAYAEREGALSYAAHKNLFQDFEGKKIEITSNS